MVSGPTSAWAASTAAVAVRSSRSANRVVGRPRDRIAGDDHFDPGRHHRLDGAAVGVAVGREHEAGREQVDDVPELAEVARDQRIGGRDRRVGDADIHGGKTEQRMLEIVAGEDRHRPLGRKIAREQRRADAAHLVERLAIADRAPFPRRVALRHERPLGRRNRPVFEPLGQLRRIGGERVGRLQQDGAVRPAVDHHVAGTEPDRPQRRGRGGVGTELFDRDSHGSPKSPAVNCARFSAPASRGTP